MSCTIFKDDITVYLLGTPNVIMPHYFPLQNTLQISMLRIFIFDSEYIFFIIFNQSYITSFSVLLTNAATHM